MGTTHTSGDENTQAGVAAKIQTEFSRVDNSQSGYDRLTAWLLAGAGAICIVSYPLGKLVWIWSSQTKRFVLGAEKV